MKSRLLVSVLLLLLGVQVCGAAITANTIWEVRPTNGSNLNGACFDSTIANAGTDYSQQNAAQLSLSDMATTGVTTTVTSVTGGFTAAMIGNCLRIDSGTNWTLGWYQITARTDTNTVTVDRAPTSAAGVTGTGKVGGATKSFSGQATTTLTNGANAVQAGNTIYVKNEAWNEAVTLGKSATASKPIIVEGYNVTRGDAPTGSNRPRNNRANVGVALTVSQTYYQIKHLWFSNALTVGISNTGAFNTYINVRTSNNATIGLNSTTNDLYLINCESDTNTQDGVKFSSYPTTITGSYIHGNTLTGITFTGGEATITNNIISANASHGIQMASASAGAVILYNTIDGNTGATTDGLNVDTSLGFLAGVVMNNIFSNNGRDGVRVTTSLGTNNTVWADYNDYFGNAGTARTNFPTGAHDVTTNPTFTNSAGGDYSIGTPLRNVGFPGTFPASTSIGHMDIGAVQSGQGAITQGACHRTVQ